jgi:hypothetical protein
MLISQALSALTLYSIPAGLISKVCLDRGIDENALYPLGGAQSRDFLLAGADIYMWLYTSPDFSEQQVSFTQAERDIFLFLANRVYAQFEDPAFTGNSFGFVGENYNG